MGYFFGAIKPHTHGSPSGDGGALSPTSTLINTDLLSQIFSYRRPVLQYVSATTVDVEGGLDGTAADHNILFPDSDFRTVTSATLYRLDLSRNAVLSGTKQSGLRSGASAANTTYAVYAVKASDNATDWVAVADTVFPIQANFATLNSNFGSNSWTHLGYIKNGDNSGVTTSILDFVQAGNVTMFRNACAGNARNMAGTRLATTASATSLAYTYAAGSGAATIPNTATMVLLQWAAGGTANQNEVLNQATTIFFARGTQGAGGRIGGGLWLPASMGLAVSDSGAVANPMDIVLAGWVDGALGVGGNPLL